MKTLTDIIAQHASIDGMDCKCGWRPTAEFVKAAREQWAAHVAAAYREARTIRIREQLDTLPIVAVIRDDDGDEMRCDRIGNRLAWWIFGSEDWLRTNGIMLPALVLWRPEDDS